MLKQSLALVVLLITLAMGMPSQASAAPGPPPPGDTPLVCIWQGVVYANNALRYAPVYGLLRTVLYYDIYRCSNGAWVYVGSTDDP